MGSFTRHSKGYPCFGWSGTTITLFNRALGVTTLLVGAKRGLRCVISDSGSDSVSVESAYLGDVGFLGQTYPISGSDSEKSVSVDSIYMGEVGFSGPVGISSSEISIVSSTASCLVSEYGGPMKNLSGVIASLESSMMMVEDCVCRGRGGVTKSSVLRTRDSLGGVLALDGKSNVDGDCLMVGRTTQTGFFVDPNDMWIGTRLRLSDYVSLSSPWCLLNALDLAAGCCSSIWLVSDVCSWRRKKGNRIIYPFDSV